MNRHSDDYIRGVRDCAVRANKVMCKACFEKLDKEIAEFRKPPAPEEAHGCIHWSNKSCESDESPCPDSAKCRYFKTAPEGENPWTKCHEQDDIEDQVLPLGHAIDMKRLGWSTEFGFVIGNDFPSAWGVTHWMPLPKPPEAWNRRGE